MANKETPFETYIEMQAEKAEELQICSGIKLNHIKKCVNEMLSFVGTEGIFYQYSLHDISHVNEMLKIIEWLIPESTKKHMTYAECLMLTLAVYFHDLGMLVTKDEYDKRANSSFEQYKKRILNDEKSLEYLEYLKEVGDDHFLYQEFVRENHAKRIKSWIEGKDAIEFGVASSACKEIGALLNNIDNKFKIDLAMICESHHRNDIDDFNKYKTNVHYGNGDQERVNLNYIAIILRIADLLHITRERTPSISRRLINPTNPISVIEWEKQNAVKAVKPMSKRNEEGKIDDTLEKDTIEITAYFNGADTAEGYFGLSSYLQYTLLEIRKCRDVISKAQQYEGATEYHFPWCNIDETQITADGFETKKLQFTIEQDNILQLLVGHTLYNDSSVVVREVVQNGIDAIKLQNYIELGSNNDVELDKFHGSVQVEWNSKKRELCFIDDGTGMTLNEVENFLLKVGASKYRTDEIRKKFPQFYSISHFGIGILTCFMVADDIDITTCSNNQSDALVITIRKVNGKYLVQKVDKKSLDPRIKNHGTKINLHIRNDVDMTDLESSLKKWIVLPGVKVTLKEDDSKPIRIGFDSLKDILHKYITDIGYEVDGIKFDIIEETQGNVTIAYAIYHSKYMSDWELFNLNNFSNRTGHQIAIIPTGTCIEGIRVEFTSPGYKNNPLLSIANIKNSNYKTNVARSAIELGPNKAVLSDIYDIYRKYLQNQMNQLEERGFSLSWALNEGLYLMNPLFDKHRYNAEPIDKDILKERLSKLKCIELEKDDSRFAVSAEEIFKLSEINIIECKMVQAAEKLLSEIRNESTLEKIIDVVCTDNFIKDTKNLICNFNENNIIHRYALQNKEITEIEINNTQRLIKLHFSNYSGETKWYHFRIIKGGAHTTLHIPKGNFTIKGLDDEIGVETIGGIYIDSGKEIYKYLINTINHLNQSTIEDKNELLEIFFNSIFGTGVLENSFSHLTNVKERVNRIMENRYLGYGEDIISKMWEQVDAEEFTKKILRKNYSLYSINNWSRYNVYV